MAENEALLRLLQWRMGQVGPDSDPLDSREIRDWLWLAAQLDGVHLPWQYTNKVRTSKAREEDQPGYAETTNVSSDVIGADPRPEARAPAPADPHLATPFPADPQAPEAAAEPVARLLEDNKLLPDDAEVDEALRRRRGGVPVRVRQPELLRYPLQILQALRPLLRRRSHPHWRELDEERSAAKSAETGLAWPVFRPRRVPMVALRVVLDGGVSMAVWEPLAQELQRVLASSQAFHRVDLQRLMPPQLPTRQPASGANDGTTVTLLLSDTAGHHWWNGSILPWLQAMANQQPLVVLHTLPLRYWDSTALQRAPALTLKNCEPLAANSRYQQLRPLRDPWDDPGAPDLLPPPGGTCLPVISLDRRDLATWAALVMGEAWARCAGRVLPAAKAEPQLPGTNDQQPSTATAEIGEEEAERLWQEFEKRASPEARELMLAMAASLFLTLPVLRLLLAVAAPRAFAPQPLAEVLVSGLVRRLPGQEGDAATPERLQFELVPALKRLLEPRLGPQRRRQVLAAVTDLLERHWDRQGKGTSFRALLLGPKEVLERDHPDLFHIANVTAAMLDQLPGRQFRELAAQLRGPKLVLQAPLWPASMVFNELEYQSAQLLPINETETLSFGTARYQEQELRPIDYETASITLVAKPRQRRKRNDPTQATTSQHSPVEIHRSKATTWAFHEPLQRDALPSGATAAAADPLSLTLVEIPAGTFLMGSPPDEPQRSDDEGPQHEVQLASFFISQTPITQAQWREVALWQPLPAERWGRELNPDPSRFQSRQGKEKSDIRLFETETNTDNRPVERVSWLEAMEFCSRLSQRTGRSYTLPSEAQWEYACRAGTETQFHFGDTISSDLANYNGKYAYADGPKGFYREQTTPVGMFPANAWGLQDMHGNIWEWCLDQWHGNYNGAPTDGSAWVDFAEGEKNKELDKTRLLRGGSWSFSPARCRSACRLNDHPVNRNDDNGFRVCCLPQD
ncbi:MAG: formylglycine-generating enzyme family protein [Cyanobium sp. 49614_E6]|nr:formylglycine-generating enzyme family protein [Cyanobium sp. 49614_E6]